MLMKFLREFVPNPDCLIIHTEKELTKNQIEMWETANTNHLNAEKPDFIRKIQALDGIVPKTFVNRYQIDVTKGATFSWDDLAPKVIQILQKQFDPTGEVEMLQDRQPTKEKLGEMSQRRDEEGFSDTM